MDYSLLFAVLFIHIFYFWGKNERKNIIMAKGGELHKTLDVFLLCMTFILYRVFLCVCAIWFCALNVPQHDAPFYLFSLGASTNFVLEYNSFSRTKIPLFVWLRSFRGIPFFVRLFVLFSFPLSLFLYIFMCVLVALIMMLRLKGCKIK